MNEKFSIPGAGGIIVKTINGEEHILIQERCKDQSAEEFGLIEIPAGKIREFENIFDCLRREIFEETGCEIEKIEGESESKTVEINGCRVINYQPFSCAQNIKGGYPIMVQLFICHLKNDAKMQKESNESKNIRWISKKSLKELLKEKKNFYPMHIETLEKYCSK